MVSASHVKLLDGIDHYKLKEMLLLRPLGKVPTALLNDPSITPQSIRIEAVRTLSSSEVTAVAFDALGVDNTVISLAIPAPAQSVLNWVTDKYQRWPNLSNINPLRAIHIDLFNKFQQFITHLKQHKKEIIVIVGDERLCEEEFIESTMRTINQIFYCLNSYLQNDNDVHYKNAKTHLNTIKKRITALLLERKDFPQDGQRMLNDLFSIVTMLSLILENQKSHFPLLLQPCKSDFQTLECNEKELSFIQEVDKFYFNQLQQLKREATFLLTLVRKESCNTIVKRKFYSALENLEAMATRETEILLKNFPSLSDPLYKNFQDLIKFHKDPSPFNEFNITLCTDDHLNETLKRNFDAKNSTRKTLNDQIKRCKELAKEPEVKKILAEKLLERLDDFENAFAKTCDIAHKIGNDVYTNLQLQNKQQYDHIREVRTIINRTISSKWKKISSEFISYYDLTVMTLFETYKADQKTCTNLKTLELVFSYTLTSATPLLWDESMEKLKNENATHQIYQDFRLLHVLSLTSPIAQKMLFACTGKGFKITQDDEMFFNEFINHLNGCIVEEDLNFYFNRLDALLQKNSNLKNHLDYYNIKNFLNKLRQFIHTPCPMLPLLERVTNFLDKCNTIVDELRIEEWSQPECCELYIEARLVFFMSVMKFITPLENLHFVLSSEQNTKSVKETPKNNSNFKPKNIEKTVEAPKIVIEKGVQVPVETPFTLPTLIAFALRFKTESFQPVKANTNDMSLQNRQVLAAEYLYQASLKLQGQYYSVTPSSKQIILRSAVILEQSLVLAIAHVAFIDKSHTEHLIKILYRHDIGLLFDTFLKKTPRKFELTSEERSLIGLLEKVIPIGSRYERNVEWDLFPENTIDRVINLSGRILRYLDNPIDLKISSSEPELCKKVPPFHSPVLNEFKTKFAEFQRMLFKLRQFNREIKYTTEISSALKSIHAIVDRMEGTTDYDDLLLYHASLLECAMILYHAINNDPRLFEKIGDTPLNKKHQLDILYQLIRDKHPALTLNSTTLSDMQDLIKQGYRYLPSPKSGYVTKGPSAYISEDGNEVLNYVLKLFQLDLTA